MTLETLSLLLGRLWGARVVARMAACYRRRAEGFDLVVAGDEHLAALAGRSFVLVSNHTGSSDTPLGRLGAVPFFRQYQHSADSFIMGRVVRERAGRALHTAAACDRARWAKRPWKRWIQRRIGQPFSRGQVQALPGYIPVERNPGCSQRPLLEAFREIAGRGEAILIFPGGITLDRPDREAHTQAGAAHIARRFDLPILPACILGSESWRLDHPVTVVFGPAFAAGAMTKAEINAEIIRRVQALHAGHVPGHARRAQGLTPPTDLQGVSYVAPI